MQCQLNDELYLCFRDLLLARSGLYYPEHKRADLLHGLNSVMSAGGYRSLDALYAAALQGGPAWELMLSHLTIGETYFFRNGAQFAALRQYILPDILARRTATRTLRVWSAGCATGEEPYSLAMTIADVLGPESWNISILATDINQQFLARAREGLFGDWSFRETPDDLRTRFWSKEQKRWRLRNEIRQMVNFASLNLADASYPSIINGTSMIDLLVCRNVTIYFDDRTTRQVVERFFRALAPGGWLIVGHSEPQASVYHQFEVHNFPNTVVYRKPLNAPLFPLEPRPATEPGSERLRSGVRPRTAPLVRNQQPRATVPLPAPVEVAYEPIPTSVALSARMQLARQSADRGEWADAVRYCEQALALDALSLDAHYLLAQIHEHQGLLDTALASYRRIIYLERSFVPGLIGMGNVWQRLGRTQEARRSYHAALTYLAQQPATMPVAGSAGATVGDMIALINQYLLAVRS